MNAPHERGRASRTFTVAALAVAAVAAVAVVGSLWATAPPRPSASTGTSAASAPPAPQPPPVVAGETVPVAAATVPPIREPVPPVAVEVGAAGIQLDVVPVGIDPNGAMELPVDPAIAGWYEYGADLAAPAGNVVIAAHVDAAGYDIGPLAELRNLPPGTEIVATGADGSERSFVIEEVTFYEKTVLPIDELFARDGPPGLVLITCGGPYDADSGSYRDNVVAVARPR